MLGSVGERRRGRNINAICEGGKTELVGGGEGTLTPSVRKARLNSLFSFVGVGVGAEVYRPMCVCVPKLNLFFSFTL